MRPRLSGAHAWRWLMLAGTCARHRPEVLSGPSVVVAEAGGVAIGLGRAWTAGAASRHRSQRQPTLRDAYEPQLHRCETPLNGDQETRTIEARRDRVDAGLQGWTFFSVLSSTVLMAVMVDVETYW